MSKSWPLRTSAGAALLAIVACSAKEENFGSGSQALSVAPGAGAFELELEGSLVTRSSTTTRDDVIAQLAYLRGQLVASYGANARTSAPSLDAVQRTPLDGTGAERVDYRVRLLAVFPEPAPSSLDVVLPGDARALSTFDARYEPTCGTGETGVETFWHDFSPTKRTCVLDEADVVRRRAVLRPVEAPREPTYPEYDRIWEDGRLELVALVGDLSDPELDRALEDAGLEPRELDDVLTSAVSSTFPEATWTSLPGRAVAGEWAEMGTASGKSVRLTTLRLPSDLTSLDQGDWALVENATRHADVVAYEGHSGLGHNIDALARHLVGSPGAYQVISFHGCQSMAYLPDDLFAARRRNDPSDVLGTKNLDVILTSRTAPLRRRGGAALALLIASSEPETPRTYAELLRAVDEDFLPLVIGDDDNAFGRKKSAVTVDAASEAAPQEAAPRADDQVVTVTPSCTLGRPGTPAPPGSASACLAIGLVLGGTATLRARRPSRRRGREHR